MAGFERYTPENPLPEEIQKLDREETVCKFCGVSYLIHNEMKKLEQKLADTLAQLGDYNEMKSRFDEVVGNLNEAKSKLLKHETDMVRYQDNISSLTNEIDGLKSILTEKSEQLSGYEDQITEKNRIVNVNNKKLDNIVTQFPILLKDIRSTKNDYRLLRDQMGVLSRTFNQTIADAINFNNNATSSVKSVLRDKDELSNDITTLSHKNKTLEEENKNILSQLSALQVKCSELNTVKHHKEELTSLAASLHLKIEEIEKENESLRINSSRLEKDISYKSDKISELNSKIDNLNKSYVQQISEINTKYESSLGVQQALQDQISVQMKQFEHLKSKNSVQCRKLQNENAELTNKIAFLENETKQVAEAKRDASKKHALQLSALHQSHEDEIKELKKDITALENTISDISSNKRGYDEALKEAIGRAKLEHEAILNSLQRDNFSAHEKLKNEISILSIRYDEDLKSKETTIRELDRSFKIQLRDLKDEKDQISKLYEEVKQNMSSYENKIMAIKSNSLSAEESSALKSRNIKLENDVLTLQRVVQKECEERLALTATLEDLKLNKSNSADRNRLTDRPKVSKTNVGKKPVGRVRKPF